ncbi:MAG TPA: TIM44-related membrane protein TimA [Phenylobacterium sp.]|nr:TIM44-related membrane protein TimA [Phenylobacterium sp.]
MFLQLIIFGALAGVVLYQLYSVLGRRVGRQPEDQVQPEGAPAPVLAPDRLPDDLIGGGVSLSGLAAVKARDPGFELPKFLAGARSAYETIVRAFAAGDRATLNGLLAPNVMKGFDGEIAARETAGRSEAVEFLHPPRADLDKAEVQGDLARMTVRFLAEFRSRTKGPEGEGVDDRRTAELWTFERNLKSRDPNWTLVHVDAAEA